MNQQVGLIEWSVVKFITFDIDIFTRNCFFNTCKARFSLREERVLQHATMGETQRRNNKNTTKTNKEQRKEITHHQHKLDYRKKAEEGTTEM
jgi:hypothetical protein